MLLLSNPAGSTLCLLVIRKEERYLEEKFGSVHLANWGVRPPLDLRLPSKGRRDVLVGQAPEHRNDLLGRRLRSAVGLPNHHRHKGRRSWSFTSNPEGAVIDA